MKLFGTMENVNGMLHIGGVPADFAVRKYGTPLIIYDETLLRDTCRTFRDGFRSDAFETVVTYASKAFSCKAVVRVAEEEGLSLDVVSYGEMYTAKAAGFPMHKVYLHGNNKSDDELRAALAWGVGTIIVDGMAEAKRLARLTVDDIRGIDVILRVNPGIDAHTHEYIRTATSDSKFGMAVGAPETAATLRFLHEAPGIRLRGIHCHIGSQIFEEDSFLKAVEVMTDYLVDIRTQTGIALDVLNLGGGFGVYYTDTDRPFALKPFLTRLAKHIRDCAAARDITLSRAIIEPGRAVVCNAGTTLYRVGDTKYLSAAALHYLFIDGGMADNPRPALYQAQYEACLANRMNEVAEKTWRVGGKCCESGDILIPAVKMPDVRTGDILAVGSTGAYTYSMSGHYNRLPKPAVIFVRDGRDRPVIRRETPDDLIQYDMD
ncbi:MAG: diaminopimelate decarboxylase [Eubacteriales bacterium]|nr:diaminopimelate decarboxylase [Eubacteriales bacterium]